MDKSTDILRQLENVAPLIPAALYWTDTQSRILGANQACLEVMGVHSADQLVGKTPYDIYPDDIAKGIVDHTNLVIETNASHTRAYLARDISTGKKRYLSSIRLPVHDADGKTCGVVGLATDITAEREAAAQHEHSRQLIGIAEKEAFAQLAHKVAHDIQSPLTALSVMLNVCDELSEPKRLILKNTFTAIKDIANNILFRYTGNENMTAPDEPRQLVLCSDFLLKCISERKYQYQELPVKFDVDIAPAAQFSFVSVQSSQLSRAIANLVSNAVDALNNKLDGKVSVKLEVDEETVKITVKDNGKGMSRSALEKIINRKKFTEGKENGHGLGMMQVWDMVENNDGRLTVFSVPGEGTTFELMFAKLPKADWIMDEITINSNDIIIVLDDDQLVHEAWKLRLTTLQNSIGELIVRHEKQGQAVLDYVASLSPDDKRRVYLLCDFELINQSMHGMQIIEASNVERAVLVTSYYASAVLQKSASQQNVKILPKQMASIVPIYCLHHSGVLMLNANEIMYDKSFYKIEQPTEKYAS